MTFRVTRALLAKMMLEFVLVVTCVVLAFSAPNFLTADNLLNVLRSVSMLGLIAFGMTMVIIAGEIDLSVGSLAAFSGCLVAYLTQKGVPIPLGIIVTLGAGALTGGFTAAMRIWVGVPSFITTLALFTALRGLALMITKGFPITSFPEWYNLLGGGYVLGIPVPGLVLVVVFALVYFLMRHTTFGYSVYAVGGNSEAARLSGISVARVRVLVFVITSVLAALSGILLSSRLMSGTPTVAQGWELDAIAGVIIGGTSFTGGTGSVWGTLIGILFIGVIINGMTLLNVPSYTQYVLRGGLILAAVLINRLQEEKH